MLTQYLTRLVPGALPVVGPPLSLRVEYESLGAKPTVLCLERLLPRLAPGFAAFARRQLAESLRSFTAWPCARDVSVARRSARDDAPFVISFAHCLWIVARPCLDWIAQAPGDDASCPWTPRLSRCVALLHEEFVGFEEDGQEQQVHHMTSLAVLLLQKHLGVDVDQQPLHDTMLSLLRRSLPATGMVCTWSCCHFHRWRASSADRSTIT